MVELYPEDKCPGLDWGNPPGDTWAGDGCCEAYRLPGEVTE